MRHRARAKRATPAREGEGGALVFAMGVPLLLSCVEVTLELVRPVVADITDMGRTRVVVKIDDGPAKRAPARSVKEIRVQAPACSPRCVCVCVCRSGLFSPRRQERLCACLEAGQTDVGSSDLDGEARRVRG